MTPEGFLLKGGKVVDPRSGREGTSDLRIIGGKIAELGPGLADKGERIIKAEGLTVAPGFVDLHVHLRDPGGEGRETIESGTAAAALGGVTSLACMPNTRPPLDSPALIEQVIARAAREGRARVYPMGCISIGRKGEMLADLAALKEAGAVAFSDDGTAVMNALLARRAMINCRFLGVPYCEHAEDENLVDGGVMHQGQVSLRLGLPGRPSVAEEILVARDVLLAQDTGARLHLMHLSSSGSLEIIKDARRRGIKLSCEVTPHHIALTDEAVGEYDTMAKVNPPLRNEEHRDSLIRGLIDGTIDAIATDHAPHGPLEKDVEFGSAAPGIIGLQTLLPICMRVLVMSGRMSIGRLIELLSSGPASILDLNAGSIEVGAPADIVVFDEKAEWVLDSRQLASGSRNTPFEGETMTGKVIHTFVGGRLVVRESAICQ